ncbi:hypothetical protein TNCV_4309041 [Trichonephila clavipes]|nr:hypothetical protein TNCV_4309041 [Trichonephila clavipes]
MAGIVTSSRPVPLKTHRVGQPYTLNLSTAQTSSRWCGVIIRRGVPGQLTMKHVTPLAFSHPRAKRVCFDKDNGKTSSFKPDAVPENNFHLESHNYAIVSDFADVA